MEQSSLLRITTDNTLWEGEKIIGSVKPYFAVTRNQRAKAREICKNENQVYAIVQNLFCIKIVHKSKHDQITYYVFHLLVKNEEEGK